MSRDPVHEASPRTQAAPRRGPPGPPKKTARDLQDAEPEHHGDPKVELSMAVTNAKMTWSELLVLNGSGPVTKREALETSLDRGILVLKRLAERRWKLNQPDLKAVTDTLRLILDYRLRFPRSNPADRQLSQRAQQVLSEVH